MINILHITYDMRIGGTEQVINNLISGADKQNFSMSVLCIESPLGPFSEPLIQQGIQIHQLNRKPNFDFDLVIKIRKIIKEHDIHIVHCHQYTPWVYGALAAFKQAKVVFTEHGRFYPDSSSLKRKVVNPIMAKLTDSVTAISQATKNALVTYEFLSKKTIKVIYNGIKPLQVEDKEVEELRLKLDISEQTIVLGTVARLDPIKNHPMMLKAFKAALNNHPKIKLIIIGDGEGRAEIESIISELKLQQNVILTGYIPSPKAYIALIDIYLLSSFSEGTSMTLLEAMSLAKPCIVTNVGGNPEVVIDNKTGLVCPSDDQYKFSDAMAKLIEEKELCSSMSYAAKQRFEDTFTTSSMVDKYQKLYKNLVGGQ
ncbi:glycosyltransferase [Thalassomonas sp. M1454]|uniref:glycosyltransferase n=1 Tax=Thalassomonas sp. M1454 TaxID=2594477 RepID=UPI0021B110F1|nr:glycosyltransferase [Thalassomonas sp. M1454]